MPRCGCYSWHRVGPGVSGYARLNLGSSVSRIQSPKKFSANTTIVMANPAKSDSHQTSSMTLRPSDTCLVVILEKEETTLKDVVT